MSATALCAGFFLVALAGIVSVSLDIPARRWWPLRNVLLLGTLAAAIWTAALAVAIYEMGGAR